MGFISRKVLPACGNMCVCCPALRPSSRQPVKRYKKLLGEIFPKDINGVPNERKILKLCEYAARNPFRVPKIVKFLEQRSYKELRVENINFIRIIMLTYSKLLCICKGQMAYLATTLLNVIVQLLDDKRKDEIRVIGCQALTMFTYSQGDNTYTHNIEALVGKVCLLAREKGEEHSKRCVRAASLECLSAKIWFMSTFSYIFSNFDEIVHVILNNFGADISNFDACEGQGSHQNWVEVVRSDAGIAPGVETDASPRNIYSRSQLEIRDSSNLTKEETENPKIWAQICIQKIVEMAKESTNMRCVLDPMFIYFDTGRHWDAPRGLSVIVLSDVLHLAQSSGNHQVIIASIIRHLDHKSVVHDPQLKCSIIQTATSLIKQLKLQTGVAEIGIISDLCRHLRKSLQATAELAGLQESNLNSGLQKSIQDCLMEISKGINDAQPLFDMMTILLEELPAFGIVARATMGSLVILANIISAASAHLDFQVFPEELFLQLLKAMMHPDVETRIGAHRMFAVLLTRSANLQSHEGPCPELVHPHEPRKFQSNNTSAFASATALLEKLHKEKKNGSTEKVPNGVQEDYKGSEISDDGWKKSWALKNSPNFYKMNSSILDRTACSTCLTDAEPNVISLNDDQIAQLLSAFWIQANQSDNLPSNFEAIAYSFSLALLSARIKISNSQIVVRIFQLPLSLLNVCLHHDGILTPSGRLSLFSMSISMLAFAGRTYRILELCMKLKPFIAKDIYVKPQFVMKEHGSEINEEAALSSLIKLRTEMGEIDQNILPLVAQSLSKITGLEQDDLLKQLFTTFTVEDELLFGFNSVFDWLHNRAVAQSDESLSFDEEISRTSSVNGDVVDGPPSTEVPELVSKLPTVPSSSHVISVGQLLESALHAAGQVAGTTISTSPLPYGTMAGQCEAFGMATRKKLSSWLGSNHDSTPDMPESILPANEKMCTKKMKGDVSVTSDSWQALRLPPSSPFDNFMKAARF